MLIKGIIAKKIYFYSALWLITLLLIVPILSFVFNITFYSWYQVLGIILLIGVYNIVMYRRIIVKPIEGLLMQVRALLTGRPYKKIYSYRTDEIGVFAHFFNEMTSSLEKVTDELAESKKVTGELQLAGQLQKELIPEKTPTIDGFDIAIKNRSAEELGGDNLDFINIGSSTYFYIGDVTGHGIPAAIVMTMVNTLINAFAEMYNSAYEIVVNTNKQIKKRIRKTMFMTMVMVKWDNLSKKMTYVGCGHEHLVVYRAESGTVDCIVSGGIALGMLADNSKIIKEKELQLNIGDVLVLYTDGITEARNMSGEMYGLDRLKTAVALYAGQNDANGLVQSIAKDFSRYVEDHIQEDDVTLMVVKKLDDGVSGKATIDQKQERWSGEE